ncbi:MAG: tRNA (5-methylaminomethyl-2-thiouridine)(34)-methyltransferase MnmD [Bacteroidia bacterium]|nr:tRNA (5-methylaminomethyl-2-thiouridine)(34)-methyltransferase MnmD [Bacteroidia bacterium]
MLDVIITQDGSPTVFDHSVQSHYHSLSGAIGESNHVFIQGSYLPELLKYGNVYILEIGFGTGLNFLLSYYQLVINTKNKIFYTAFEPDLLPELLMAEYYHSLPAYLPKLDALTTIYQRPISPTITVDFFPLAELTVFSCPFSKELIKNQQYDCIFLDAFDSKISPELWDEDAFLTYFELLKNGGCLVSYGITGQVQRILKKHGFFFQKPSGFGNKREMLRVWKQE